MLASAHGPIGVLAGWLLAGTAMAACLYDPVFATLHQIAGSAYRRAVTALTLLGGLASTVFWPLSQYLLDTVGWRTTFVAYAVAHLVLCLPIHVMSVPAHRAHTSLAAVDPATHAARCSFNAGPWRPRVAIAARISGG